MQPGIIRGPPFQAEIPGMSMIPNNVRKFAWPASTLVVLLAMAGSSGCRSPYHADRGAALGGLTGAIAGAAIGDRSGNAAAGAVVGTAVGALTGAAIGEAIDEDLARSQAIVQQRLGRQISGAVTREDVIAMVQAGVSDEVIVTQVRANGVSRRPDTHDVIEMSRQGVREPVILAMQQAVIPNAEPVTYVTPAPPAYVVEQHYYGPPPYWRPRPVYHRPYHACAPGVRFGVSFR
jgi:hypothetical protein